MGFGSHERLRTTVCAVCLLSVGDVVWKCVSACILRLLYKLIIIKR